MGETMDADSENTVTVQFDKLEIDEHKSTGRHFWNTDGEIIAELLKMAESAQSNKFNELLRAIQHAKIIRMLYGAEHAAPENA